MEDLRDFSELGGEQLPEKHPEPYKSQTIPKLPVFSDANDNIFIYPASVKCMSP